MNMEKNNLKGIYKYFWITLKDSDFIKNYFDIGSDAFINYLKNPEQKAIEFVKSITSVHRKSAPTISALNVLDKIEGSIGRLREGYRKHLVHSINVLLLGLCFVEKNPKIRQALLHYPGETININENLNNEWQRISIFHFRWIFSCFFHDIGYVFELLAKGLDPDEMGLQWEGIEEERRGINRMKHAIQRELKTYFNELRELPYLTFLEGYDNRSSGEYFHERIGRKVENEKDILKLFSNLISKSLLNKWGDKQNVFSRIESTFNSSFIPGLEKTFDHGKIGSFIMLHEIRTYYQIGRMDRNRSDEISWHRANIYYEIMDSALAIYLHNTLRFQLNKGNNSWGLHNPLNIPPLSYLLTLCDIIVEWDKEQIGFGDSSVTLRPEEVDIQHPDNNTIKIFFESEEFAKKVKKIITGLIDPKFVKFEIQCKIKNSIN
jgi:hypothetical protein